MAKKATVMRLNFFTLCGAGFYLLAIFGALRVRHDLVTMQTAWSRTLFCRTATPILRQHSPARYWLAIITNLLFVLVFVFAGGLVMRAGAGRFTRF